MLRAKIVEFSRNEAGGGTIMGLLWFVLLVGITGLAVDVTDGFRNRTMLQATADAAALAAVIDLPDNVPSVVATAVSYSVDNMGADTNGFVLDTNDVYVGLWDAATQSLDTGSAFPDAVMVTVSRSADNANALPVNFLRIIGLQTWNVTAQAVAQRFIPECLRDGLIAREIVDMSSNNSFVNEICIHGQLGVNLQSNNYFETGVNVSMIDLDTLELPASGMDSNIGLPPALRENNLDPRDVNHVDSIMRSFLDPTSDVQNSYTSTTEAVIREDEKFNLANAESGRIYFIECAPNKNVSIPSNSVIDGVVIIAECEIKINAGATITNSVLGSLSGGNPGQGQGGGISSANIGVAANVQLGEPDNCADGGGVQLFSNATIHTAASTALDGVQMVAAGDIELGARDLGINGISAQAGGTITLTSNNQFGLCSGGAPNLFTVDYYRLVL
jgi:Flp pilus assembly protein TadG